MTFQVVKPLTLSFPYLLVQLLGGENLLDAVSGQTVIYHVIELKHYHNIPTPKGFLAVVGGGLWRKWQHTGICCEPIAA